MKHIAATISVLIACAIGLQALEAREGLVKLVVDESTARISVYRLVDVTKDRYEPLLFDSDPRTSFATLSVDGRLYKLGDAAEFRPTTKRTDTGAQIEFRSASVVVRQILDFARSDGSALADGLRVSFEDREHLGRRGISRPSLSPRYVARREIGHPFRDRQAPAHLPGDRYSARFRRQLGGDTGRKSQLHGSILRTRHR